MISRGQPTCVHHVRLNRNLLVVLCFQQRSLGKSAAISYYPMFLRMLSTYFHEAATSSQCVKFVVAFRYSLELSAHTLLTAHREFSIKDFLQVTCLKCDGISNGFGINHETEASRGVM